VFTAGGVDHTGATVDTLVFPAGTITVTHSKSTSTQTFNPKTAMNSRARFRPPSPAPTARLASKPPARPRPQPPTNPTPPGSPEIPVLRIASRATPQSPAKQNSGSMRAGADRR
jgi:hypothetical protein